MPHQGCSRYCVFCHQPHITGVTLHTPVISDDVRRQIDLALAEPKSQQKGAQFEVAFYGGTFTGLDLQVQERLLHAVQVYVDQGRLTGIRLSTHPAMFNERIFALIRSFSVQVIELGIQSFHNDVLRRAGRGHTAEEASYTIQRLQSCGIEVGIHLMIGLPGDSYDKSMESARKTVELHPTSVRIHPTLVIRGTQLEKLYNQKKYTPLTLNVAVTTCKDMLKLFREHHIPVIRIGLQPTESMEQNLIAGPYHPAIRQLVESEILYDSMVSLCVQPPLLGDVPVFYVSPQDVSTARGQRNKNIKKLQQQFLLKDIRILSDINLQRGQIRRGESRQSQSKG